MYFQFGLRSSLLLVFFTHLVVYAVVAYRRGVLAGNTADKLLGVYLFLAALFIFPWMSGFAGWYDTQPYRDFLSYTPFIHALAFGPLLYFYLKCLTNANYRLSRTDILHFLPALLYALWAAISVIIDRLLLGRYFLVNGETDPDFDTWYQCAWCVSVAVYLLLAIRYYRQYRAFTYLEFSFAEAASFRWLRNVLYVFALLTVLFISKQLVALFVDLHYIRAWYYYFAFAVVNYYLAISAYGARVPQLVKLNFAPALLLEYTQALPGAETADTDYVDVSEADDAWNLAWADRVRTLMEEDRVFLQPDLTLSGLARLAGTNATVLSRVINRAFGQNFNDYVNGYRVREAISLLADEEYRNLNLLAIAYDAGFNSKATFNRAFKKSTGSAPKSYLAGLNLTTGEAQ